MLEAGQQFGHFKIDRMLGEGGMGQVFLAEDQQLGRQVALKVLTKQYFDDTERLERFKREARTAAQVTHPNVMAIYDIGSAADPTSGQDVNYIVMEYIAGRPLSEYMKGKSTDLAVIVRLAEKIASGLAAAHKMQVVHRDIKADNIIVNEEEQPKILDFGLAKPIEPMQMTSEGDSTRTISRELTKAGKIIGTVSYMSPEQVRGEKVDARSDIFSFGVLLYRMATGELPFAGTTEVSTLAKILETRHDPLRLKNENVPQELERIVDKCLQKDPNDRYQDTRDLVVDLRNLRRQYDSGVTDTISTIRTAPVKIQKSRSINLSWKLVVLVVVVIAILAGVVRDWLSGKGGGDGKLNAKENSLAVLSFENKTGDKSLDWMETGLPEILLTDLAETKSINLISRQRIMESLDQDEVKAGSVSSEDYLNAAKDLGATTVLSGSYFKVGDKVRIDARLENIENGKVLLGEKVVGTDPFALVDSLTKKVAASMNITQAATDRGVASVTSSSPEAYKQYMLGMDKMAKLQADEALPYFEQAVAIDSTFALAYVRIGMANAVQGRSRQAADAFEIARRLEGKLPSRERGMLDVYCDIWLNRKFDDAFTKLQLLVTTYPDDFELRSVYGILTYEFTHDTVKAFAQLDTAFVTYPQYLFGLSFEGDLFLNFGQYDRALAMSKKIKGYHPDAWTGYSLAARVYVREGKLDDAASEVTSFLKRSPLDSDALLLLGDIYLRKRDFVKVQSLTDSLRVASQSDPYKLRAYYERMANLSTWTGHFRPGLQYYRQVVDLMISTKDSLNLSVAYTNLGSAYQFLEINDSAIEYAGKAEALSGGGQFPNLPLAAVEIDPRNESWARPIMEKWTSKFRSTVPKELWGITDALKELFEGYVKRDTARMVSALQDLVKVQGETFGSGNRRSLAQLMIAIGQYKEGKQALQGYVSGSTITTDAADYMSALYYLGRAEEGLGNRPQAVSDYQEYLKYWGKADVEVPQIKDVRARLARLTS